MRLGCISKCQNHKSLSLRYQVYLTIWDISWRFFLFLVFLISLIMFIFINTDTFSFEAYLQDSYNLLLNLSTEIFSSFY